MLTLALNLSAEFLSDIRKYLLQLLSDDDGEMFLAGLTISYVITVPEQWSKLAREVLRGAAIQAGLGSQIEVVSNLTALGMFCMTTEEGVQLRVGSTVLGKKTAT